MSGRASAVTQLRHPPRFMGWANVSGIVPEGIKEALPSLQECFMESGDAQPPTQRTRAAGTN